MMRPSESLIGEMDSEMSTGTPSLRTRTVSKCSTGSPRRRRAITSAASAARSGGMMRAIERPIASAGE